ncbi:1183_t:CDS:2 [Gigaspora margarita]|uniref:1183_t:CDS:1 n=1 Tax=Gigaspora margarita TaxID=4874 RepID=A0ABN7UJE7_GIGMA|nr:1183_t:CDS:2 [Gigaspora margarita]
MFNSYLILFDTQFIFDFILVADKFLLEELVDSLEAYLIESKAHWLRTHFIYIYKTCFQNNKLKELQKWCNNILAKHPNIIFDSEDFNSLNETALVSLIKRDDLQMEETKIWNDVVKWGIAQNPNLTSDPEEWPDENFMTLKDILKNCLPHIRYFQMSSEDIANYVLPYFQVLEKQLWKDLNKSHLSSKHKVTSTILPPRIILKTELPTRSTELFSSIINEEHAAEIASWIDKNNTAYSIRNNPYEFKLLLRGSKDGFTRELFWNLCNKKANTVTVMNVKSKNNIERIFGGYNPLEWDNSKKGWNRCHDSFVFSLKNTAIQNSILGRVKNPAKAFYNDTAYGVYFAHQLGMFVYNYNGQVNGRYTRYNSNYCEEQIDVGPPKTPQYYFVNEYEVFQIHKKSE